MSTLPLPTPDSPRPLTLAGDEPPASPNEAGVLDRSHIEQLQYLVHLSKPVRKAARYAGMSGWMTLLAGGISVPFALHNTPLLIFSVALAALGTRELSLRRRLLALETSAPRRLAINQLLLGATLVLYAGFMLALAPAESVIASTMQQDAMLTSTPEISGQLDELAQLEKLIKAGVYALLIVLALIFQGGAAIFYATRSKRLREIHQRCPLWAVRVYRCVHTGRPDAD